MTQIDSRFLFSIIYMLLGASLTFLGLIIFLIENQDQLAVLLLIAGGVFLLNSAVIR